MDKNEEKEFENILDIDKSRLDDESENQPYLVWQHGKAAAKAMQEADYAKAALKVIEAEVDLAVRDDPEDFDLPGDKKPTEEMIKKAILRSKKHKGAVKVYNDALYKVNMLEAANKSLEHRRTSLTMLNGQDERGYFARPRQGERVDTGRNPRRKALKRKKKKRA